MDWLILALIAITIWAIGGIFGKFLRTHHVKSVFSYWILTIPAFFYILFFFNKINIPNLYEGFIALIGGILGFIGYFIFIYAIRREEVSKAVTVYSSLPLFVLIFAIIFLNEYLSFMQIIAFIMIMAAIFLLLIEKQEKSFKFKSSILILLIGVLAFTFQNILYKTLSQTNFETILFFRQLPHIFGIFLLIMPKLKNDFIKDFKNLGIKKYSVLLVGEIFAFAGLIFLFLAIQSGPVSLVSLIQASQAIITMVLATILTLFIPRFIKEDISPKALLIKIISIALMIGGIALLQ